MKLLIVPMIVKFHNIILYFSIDLFITTCYNEYMNKEQVRYDTYPKYSAGQIVLATHDTSPISATITSSYYVDSGWFYVLEGFHYAEIVEENITHVLNAGYWIPSAKWNPYKELKEESIADQMFEDMIEDDPDEEAFIEEQRKIFLETKTLRDEVPKGEERSDEE